MCYPEAVQPCPACRSVAAGIRATESATQEFQQQYAPSDENNDLDVWMQTQQENHRLRDALLACVAVAKAWHAADDVWEIYYNHSPEMKPIRDVLGLLP
jgi:hypothetical protein